MSFSPLSPFSSVYCQWVQCERVKAWVKRLYQLQGGTVYIINARIHDVWTPHGKGWGQSIKAASAFQLVRLFRGFYFLYKSILTLQATQRVDMEKSREREKYREKCMTTKSGGTRGGGRKQPESDEVMRFVFWRTAAPTRSLSPDYWVYSTDSSHKKKMFLWNAHKKNEKRLRLWVSIGGVEL